MDEIALVVKRTYLGAFFYAPKKKRCKPKFQRMVRVLSREG
jgi:hypothetical protein